MTNLGCTLVETAGRHPDRAAVRCGAALLTYRGLLDRARATAAGLVARGLSPGDRVGLVAGNEPGYAVAFHAALLAGCVVVPMNPLLSEREMSYYLRDSAATAVLHTATTLGPALVAAAEGACVDVVDIDGPGLGGGEAAGPPVVDRRDDDTAVILYTSGTTGTPKGAELTHANLRSNAATSAAMFGLTPADVVLGCLPLFHVFGLTCGLDAAVAVGACLTLVPRFDPTVALATIERDGATVFIGVPTMYSAMLAAPERSGHDVSTLRLCASGGAAMPVEVLRGFEREFGCVILEGYGLSETSPVAAFNHRDAERKPGSIGTPVAGMAMRLVDDDGVDVEGDTVGEIAIRGEGLMTGYWRRPEETSEAIPDGWFRTGDLARRDADGYYFIVDRRKDLIIRGGYNVYPREVEEVLYEHPAVAAAAVVGLPHPELGEEVGAAVVLAPGTEADVAELRAFVKDRLAPYKYPRRVWFVDALPTGPTGKILRREVRPPGVG